MGVGERAQRAEPNEFSGNVGGNPVPGGLMQDGEPRLSAGPPPVNREWCGGIAEQGEHGRPVTLFRRIGQLVTRGDHLVGQQRRVAHPEPRLFVRESVVVVLSHRLPALLMRGCSCAISLLGGKECRGRVLLRGVATLRGTRSSDTPAEVLR